MKSILKELMGWLLYIIIIVGAAYLIVTFVGQRTQVSGSSMETTLSDGDQLIVDKISYRFRDPKRYDIIVFPYQYEPNTYYIKRIIGLPGETIQIIDGYIYIDGEQLDEHYGNELMNDPGLQRNRSLSAKTNILCWAITGTTARTAGRSMWE